MKFQIDAWRKWAQLSPLERRLLVQAWMVLLIIYFALRVMPFNTILAACQRASFAQQSVPERTMSVSALRLAWLMDVASRYSVVTATCLNQALALSWLLSRHDMSATLRIGVSRSMGHLTAHAWIEQNGQIILGVAQAETHTPLFPVQPFEGHPS